MGPRRCYGLAVTAVLVTACAGGRHAGPAASSTTTTVAVTVARTATAPATSASTTAVTMVASGPVPDGTSVPDTFTSSVAPLTDDERKAMTGVSWRRGCPVGLDALRMVTLTFVDTSGAVHHDGRMVVRDSAAEAVVAAFHALFDAGYPIDRMEPVDVFGGDDGASMAADNTSAFNCRPVTGGETWSRHAYGTAVDVNPLYNPWVKGSRVEPAEGARWEDRTRADPRVIRRGGVVVRAFAAVGWGWGGDFTNLKDWQHFSADGR